MIVASSFFTGGKKHFAIAPKCPRKAGNGVVHITAKNVPPKTTRAEGTSRKGPSEPAEEIILPPMKPSAPSIPISEAKSIMSALYVFRIRLQK
jgi:hypothetical protein